MTGDASNSIPDWVRILQLDDIDEGTDDTDDSTDDSLTITSNNEDAYSSNDVMCVMGSGLSPDHS